MTKEESIKVAVAGPTHIVVNEQSMSITEAADLVVDLLRAIRANTLSLPVWLIAEMQESME
jgi:hypothetical protein